MPAALAGTEAGAGVTIAEPPAHAGSEQKLNRFWRGIGTTDRPISAAAQKATAKGSTMTLQTILDPERAASSIKD
jgi:hypothetical protein